MTCLLSLRCILTRVFAVGCLSISILIAILVVCQAIESIGLSNMIKEYKNTKYNVLFKPILAVGVI